MAMRKEAISGLLGDNKKAVAINTILIANAFIWYSYAFNYLITAIGTLGLTSQLLPIISIHFAGLFLALIIGVLLVQKIKDRFNFLLLWTLAGVFLSLIPLITGITYVGIVIFSVI